MIKQKCLKNAEKFVCLQCNFKCSKKSNYNTHLLTTKHNLITNDKKKMPKKMREHKCECEKIYKYASGLSRHKLKCKFTRNNKETDEKHVNEISEENIDYKEMFLRCMAQNNELMNIISSQAEKSEEMMGVLKDVIPKIGNTTNNNNTFNLQLFLNEDCKDAINFSEFIENIKVSFEDLEHQAQVGYVNGVSKLFIENLRDLGTHKRPIHCTDKKRKTLYIKNNNEWDKEGSQNTLKKGIREISRKGFECLMNEKKENQEEYKDIESDFTQKCLSIHRNILPGVPQETTISKVIEKISQNSGINE